MHRCCATKGVCTACLDVHLHATGPPASQVQLAMLPNLTCNALTVGLQGSGRPPPGQETRWPEQTSYASSPGWPVTGHRGLDGHRPMVHCTTAERPGIDASLMCATLRRAPQNLVRSSNSCACIAVPRWPSILRIFAGHAVASGGHFCLIKASKFLSLVFASKGLISIICHRCPQQTHKRCHVAGS